MSEAGRVLTTGTEAEAETAVEEAASAIRRGQLVVLPTDTVYGLGADAFDPDAVQALLDAKGRGRDMPPPVLVSAPGTLAALARDLKPWVHTLVEEFWPGPLTLVCLQQGSLDWDLGETRGTVAVRMPDHDLARQLLERTGPMAVSSANLSGQDAAQDAESALAMLGTSVEVYLDAGATPGPVPSTIIDCTTDRPRLLRPGGIGVEELDRVLAAHGTSVDVAPDPDEE